MKSIQKKIDEISKIDNEYTKDGNEYVDIIVQNEDLKKFKEFRLECDKATFLYNLYNVLLNACACQSKIFSAFDKVDNAYHDSILEELEEDDFDFDFDED